MSAYEPKVGDRVSWWRCGRCWGNVARVTRATAFVIEDGHSTETAFRRSKRHGFGLSPETEAERAEKRWISERPETNYAIVAGLGAGTPRVRVADVYAEEIGAVIADLQTIKAWFERRPEGA